MQSYTYTMCTCKSCETKGTHPEKGELPPWKVSNNAESKERGRIVFFAREKNPWSNQGESLTCWICLEEFSSKACVYGPTLWWPYETKTSLAEYFQRHYKLNCFCFISITLIPSLIGLYGKIVTSVCTHNLGQYAPIHNSCSVNKFWIVTRRYLLLTSGT